MKHKIFRRIALLLSLVMLLTSTVNTTFGFIVTKTDSLVNIFTPFDSAISDLMITKKVEHPLGDQYVIPNRIAFDYQVELGSLYANTTVHTSQGDVVADANGVITVAVTPGKTLTVRGIDSGTKVKVTELQTGNGFAVKDGVAAKEGTVSENSDLKFDYVNVYTPAPVQPGNVLVTGTKVLQGRQWQAGDSFRFTLEQKTGSSGWKSLDTQTVTYDANNQDFNRFDFTAPVQALTFDEVGVYQFRITEAAGNLENVDYDRTVNTFNIRVTDVDMDGKLEINSVTADENATVSEQGGNYNVAVVFRNTYVPAPPGPDPENIAVNIRVEKTVKNTGVFSITPEDFEFVLENTASGEKLTQKSNEKGKAAFELPFAAADVGKIFTYQLSETNTGKQGVTYDTKVYDIAVAIALGSDNKLVATVTVDGEKVENAVLAFSNTYDRNPEDIALAVTARKKVNNVGKKQMGPQGFEIVLKNTETGEKQKLKTNEEGVAEFNLPLTAADIGKTYTYQLSETNTGKAGVTYDKTVYDICVSVILGENQKLAATVTLDGKPVDDAAVQFVNTYNSEDPKTGDDTNLVFWAVMMLLSGAACLCLVIWERKHRKKKQM